MKAPLLHSLVLSCAALVGCADPGHHALRQNKAIVLRYFDRWANHGDQSTADELIAVDLVLHNPPAVLPSLAEYKTSMAAFHAAFPDLHFTIEDEFAEGEKVVVRWTLRATHQGEFQGHPASGKPVEITGTSVFLLRSGKIQEIWVNMDRLGLMQQLGWLPAPPSSAR